MFLHKWAAKNMYFSAVHDRVMSLKDHVDLQVYRYKFCFDCIIIYFLIQTGRFHLIYLICSTHLKKHQFGLASKLKIVDLHLFKLCHLKAKLKT